MAIHGRSAETRRRQARLAIAARLNKDDVEELRTAFRANAALDAIAAIPGTPSAEDLLSLRAAVDRLEDSEARHA